MIIYVPVGAVIAFFALCLWWREQQVNAGIAVIGIVGLVLMLVGGVGWYKASEHGESLSSPDPSECEAHGNFWTNGKCVVIGDN